MSPSLVISFVIGGLFLISILAFNANVSNSSQEITLTGINQTRMDDIVELVSNDFSKIGFNTGIAVPFTTVQSDEIIFQSDVYDNDSFGVTNIRWYFDTSDAVTGSSNPNDYYLKREGPIGTSSYGTIEFPVIHFELNYYTSDGTSTTNLASVKKIKVEIVIETEEPFALNDNNQEYPTLVWERTFVPNNINLPY